ncbi:MAG TPA: undecaprenyl-diphosphate phosphatase [Trebonia sp.]|nr:undecaprenyl-diphosphate phosphatase [Trebonia sp.]
MYHLTYLQAVVTGLVQGVTELFPVSSLGHNVLLPALIGGSWAKTLNVSATGSPYLAFIVGLHVATAIAMIAFFWRDWLRIVRGFFSSIGQRRVATPDQRLAWMIILGTIPVGLVGLVAQKEFIKVFAKPELAATFLAINGLILLASERMRRRKENRDGGGLRAAFDGPGGGPRPAFDGPGFGPGSGPGGPGGRPAGGPPPGYSQQPRQQQWQGSDPRYGQDDRYGRDDRQRQGGGGRHGRGGPNGPDGQPTRDGQYGREQYGQDQYGRDPRGGQPQQAAPYGQQPWDGRPGPGQQDTWRDQARQQDGDPRGARDPRNQGDPWATQQQPPAGRHGRPGDGRPASGGGPWDGRPGNGRPGNGGGDGRGGDGRPGPNGAEGDPAVAADRRLSTIGYKRAVFIGATQILALLPGISRDGIVTVAGMGRGLTRQDAVRYSFLLSAPVILAAGALKASDLTGPMSKGMHGPIIVGSIIAGLGAYLSIRFLTKYFSEDKSLNPFGYYCIIAGLGSLAYLVLK